MDEQEDLGVSIGSLVVTCISALIYGSIVHVAFPALTLLQAFVICYAFVVFVNSL